VSNNSIEAEDNRVYMEKLLKNYRVIYLQSIKVEYKINMHMKMKIQ